MHFLSPLRYPGGKRKLANFLKLVYSQNDLIGSEYAEPYAGGASVALALLYDEYVQRIYINDVDASVYAFWYSVLNETDELCKLVRDTKVSIDEWQRQRSVQTDPDASLLKRGFSTFFLNRTNRSGIISAGVIGGKEQAGDWSLDARYNKDDLIARIQKVARYRKRISLHNQDAADFIPYAGQKMTDRSLMYLDPPYYVKGQQQLYINYYEDGDHAEIANIVHGLICRWIVSYDNIDAIVRLYERYNCLSYGINYSAQLRYLGSEVMFFCDQLQIPEVRDPTKLTTQQYQQFLL